MARKNQVYVYVQEGGERETLLNALCAKAGLTPSHSAYRHVIDAALTALAAGVTEVPETKGEER